MKRLLASFIIVIILLTSGVTFVACGAHTHLSSEQWSKDETYHWHICTTDATCSEQLDKSEHVYEEGICMCGAEDSSYVPQLTKAELATAYKTVANQSWVQFGASTVVTTQTVAYTSELPDSDLEEKTTPDGIKLAKADAATMFSLIYMIGEYYENDNFLISDGVVTLTLQAVNMSQTPCSGTMHLLPTLDKQNNNVKLEMILHLPNMNNMEVSAYYNFDINYDFNTNTLISFNLVMVQDYIQNDVPNTQFSHEKMTTDGKYFWLKHPQSNEYKTVALEIRESFNQKVLNAISLQGNFDTEFNNYLENSLTAYNAIWNS